MSETDQPRPGATNVGGPYVQAAAFCDRVLREHDGVVSAIRLIDSINVEGTSVEMSPIPVQLNALVSVKSGDATGTHQFRLRPPDSDGIRAPEIASPILLNGGEHGMNLTLSIGCQVVRPGLYWFDVVVDGQILTRLPIRIRYSQRPPDGATPPPAP